MIAANFVSGHVKIIMECEMSIQKNFIFQGNKFLCEGCGETLAVDMPVSFDLFMLLSQAFQIYHLKKCFGESGPYDSILALMDDFYKERDKS